MVRLHIYRMIGKILGSRRTRKTFMFIRRYWYMVVLLGLLWHFYMTKFIWNTSLESSTQGDMYADAGTLTYIDEALGYIANNVEVIVNVFRQNGPAGKISYNIWVTLTNNGLKDITYIEWQLYLTHLHGLFQRNSTCGLELKRADGRVYYLEPLSGKFSGIKSHTSVSCELNLAGYITPDKSMFMPNWYVASQVDGVTPRIVRNTAADDLDFVNIHHAAAKPSKLTPLQMFDRFTRTSDKFDAERIIPAPETTTSHALPSTILDNNWIIVNTSDFPTAVDLLSKKLTIVAKSVNDIADKTRTIKFELKEDLGPEEYKLHINGDKKVIKISASSPTGAFYGAQSLVSLYSNNKQVPSLLIEDKPRFPFRSLMLDVARNFHTKDTVIELLHVMAMYKLNKFHFHLTDDEGWRVEIPAFPELTEYGSCRCHNLHNKKCLVPSYGSGPDINSTGSGFYSVQDYRDILKVAEANHIQVIPEIDMPGHAKATLQAMSHRKDLLRVPFDLFDNASDQESPQGWRKNVLNPCLNSTYRFVTVLLDELVKLHEGVQRLETVHLGGDEVQWTIWNNSPACHKLGTLGKSHALLKALFTREVSIIAHKKNLDVAFWNDALLTDTNQPVARDSFPNKNVYVNFWHDRKLDGNALMVKFADAGFKVVISTAERFYFDHKYETNPDENGQVWATDCIDTVKVFSAIPSSYKLTCSVQRCPKTTHPDNIYGLQASLWGEVIRGREALHFMLFPRLLALAERAWHKARWENIESEADRRTEQKKDWTSFANALGHKELPRLEKLGIHYRVPPPVILHEQRASGDELFINTVYPNHEVSVKFDTTDSNIVKAGDWSVVKGNRMKLAPDVLVALQTISPGSMRPSRKVYFSRVT